ncbi:TPA: ABC transporter substrate-binding protein [bacterium]|nr:ABC transporter substrate-binding protein [bacterium]
MIKRFIGVILLASVFFGGCGQKREAEILKIRLSADVTTLDPALIVDVSGGIVASKLYNSLIRYDNQMQIVPDLAEDWSISPDGKTYTFRLKPGVRFTNNREVNAEDIKYSFRRILDPKTRSPRQWVLDRVVGADEFMEGKASDVSGLKVLDRYTIQIEIREPFAPFIGLLAMPAAYVVPKEEVQRWGEDFGEHPMGTGPFVLSRWRRDEEILLFANQDYFEGPPQMKGIAYRIIPQDLTATAEFISGGLDIMGLPSGEFSRFMSDPNFRPYILNQAGLNVYYLGLNCQKYPFDRIRVRQALNYAIDKELILKTLLKDRGVVAYGPIPPVLAGSNQNISPYPYDPEKAKELLRQEGLKNGLSMKIYQRTSQEALSITQAIQAQLKEVGIETEIIQLDWSAFKEAINKGEVDAFYLAWVADYPDAENFLFPLFHSRNIGPGGNRARFSNKEIDALLEKAISTIDDKTRIALYQEVEAEIHKAAPWVFLWHLKEHVVYQPWVKGFKLYPIYNADKATTVALTKNP